MQYGATSGLLEYSLQPAANGDGAAQPPGLPLPVAVPLSARLPFMQQDVQQGSGSLRPGDHVTFRIATNLQVRALGWLAGMRVGCSVGRLVVCAVFCGAGLPPSAAGCQPFFAAMAVLHADAV